MTESLSEKQARLDAMRFEIFRLRKQERELDSEISLLKAGVEVGDTVECRDGRFIIDGADGWTIYGRIFKKDGTLGIGRRNIYGIKSVTKAVSK